MTGLEPATSGVTGRHSNRLSYTRAVTNTVDVCVVGGWIRGSHAGVKRCNDGCVKSSDVFLQSPVPAFFQHNPNRRIAPWGLRFGQELLNGPARRGRLAQLVERFVYTEDVGGSSPSSPTSTPKALRRCYEVVYRFTEPRPPTTRPACAGNRANSEHMP